MEALDELTNGRTNEGVIGGPSDDLLFVSVDSEPYQAAVRVRDAIVAEVGDAQARYGAATDALQLLAADKLALDSLLPRAAKRAAKVREVDQLAQQGVSAMAAAMYVGDTEERLMPDDTLTTEERLDSAQRAQVASSAADRATVYALSTRERLLETTARLEELQLRSLDTDTRVITETRRRDAAAEDFFDAAERAVSAERDVRAARALADVDDTDLTLVALDAYWRAASAVADESPGCGISWWALAGIGRTESNHGRYGGRNVGIDGQVDSPVVGIPLDGTNATRLIPDSDGGRFDNDPLFDRAVGPMQFIPSTWRRWGADLSGNGVDDPQNFYDATLAAARYLCAYGPGLDTDVGLRRAFFGYNRSLSYVDLVLSRAHGYRDAGLPLG